MKACLAPSVREEVLRWSKADGSTASQNAWLWLGYLPRAHYHGGPSGCWRHLGGAPESV